MRGARSEAVARLAGLALALPLLLAFGPGPLRGRVPGADAWTATQAWWSSRRLDEASARLDATAQLELAAAHLRLTGEGDPFLFAVHRLAIDRAAPSGGLGPREALDIVEGARHRLVEALPRLPEPGPAVLLHEILVATRMLPLAGPSEALAVTRLPELLAAGGLGRPDPAPYREFLALPPAGRNDWILDRLRRIGP